MRKPLFFLAVLLLLVAGGVAIWIANRRPKMHVNQFIGFHYASTVEHYTLVETPLPEDIYLSGHFSIYVDEDSLVNSYGIDHVEKNLDLDGKPGILIEFSADAADRLRSKTEKETDYLVLIFDSRILLLSPLDQIGGRKNQITIPDVAKRDELYDLLTGETLPHITWGLPILEKTHANRKCIYREYENGARVIFWLDESGKQKYSDIIVMDESSFLTTEPRGFYPEHDIDKDWELVEQRKQEALEKELIWYKKRWQEEKRQLEQEAAQQPPE